MTILRRFIGIILAFAVCTGVVEAAPRTLWNGLKYQINISPVGATTTTVESTYPHQDTAWKVCDNGDITKCVTVELSGITTANTGVLTFAGTAAAFNLTTTGRLQLGDGAAATPALRGTTDNAGIYFDQATTGRILYSSEGAVIALMRTETTSNATLSMGPNTVGFSSSLGGPDDIFIGRESAATTQWGKDVNGAAVAQIIKGPDAITGSNVAGGAFAFKPGLGTGTAVSGPATIDRQIAKASGTTAQTYAPAVVVCPSKGLSTTTGTTQSVATVSTTSVSGGAVTMDYTVVACSATVCNTDSGIVKYGWRNAAGTVTSTVTAVVAQSDTDASGTLAATPGRSDSTNVMTMNVAPAWVTIVPTSVVGFWTFTVASAADTVVCQ